MLLWNLLLTAGLAILLALLCRSPWLQRRPAFVHWLWLLLLVKLITPPLISVPLLPATNGHREAVAVATLPNRPARRVEATLDEFTAMPDWPEVSTKHSQLPVADLPPVVLPADDPVLASHNEPAVSNEPVVAPRKPRGKARDAYVAGLLTLSLFGTCVLFVVHGAHAMRFNRWLKRAGTEDSELAETCTDLTSSMGIRGNLRCCVVDTRTTPLLWGWRRPVVAFPRQLVDELEPDQLRSILAHELAHLVRRDHWVNLFVCVVKALMWWNPVVWWADRELRVAQEMCCDAMAIERCKAKPSSYAATLLKTLDFIHPPVASSRLALGMGSRGTILRRFEMIGERGLTYRTSRWAILGLLVVGTALACMPVRGQEKKPAADASPTASEVDTAVPPAKTQNVESEKTESGKTIVDMLSEALGTATEPLQREKLFGKRPHGNCSISGKVACAETGEPISGATVYLFYSGTHSAIFVNVASDGTFEIKDIPAGPHSLQTQNTPGYQSVVYNPDGKSSPLPQFTLKEREHRSDIVLKAKRAYRISGKVRDANGEIPEDVKDLTVSAIVKTGGRYQWAQGSSVKKKDGSYTIDGLDGQPVYLMVTNRSAQKEGNSRPPVYYPSTFSRNKAKQVEFGEHRSLDDIDITLRTEGGSTLEGKIVNEDGDPVSEAFVLVHHRDMFGDNLTAYTDEQGQYRIQGLGEGEFLVHVDAAHRGYVRLRSPVDLDDTEKQVTRDFTLAKGVLITGKLVDREGNDWEIGKSFGHAHVRGEQNGGWTFTRTGLFNKYGPENVSEYHGSPFSTGEGEYSSRQMIFPTKSTFAIHGMTPGQTRLSFLPAKEGQEVFEIRYKGKNILGSDFETKPGELIDDVVVVIGKKDATVAKSGVKAQQERPFGDRPRGNCSISGKVISAETGEPVDHATVYLFYMGTHSGMFVNVASDGTFLMKDIPTGPFSLTTTNTAGYQDLPYNPEGGSGPYPRFSLNEGEHRSGVVFEIKPACQISGKVLDEQGKVPKWIDEMTVLAWVENPDGKFRTEQARVNRNDGSFSIDRLDKTPAYVMAVNWKANRADKTYPPVYYPSTFNRDDARRIAFDAGRKVENVDITVKDEGGLVLVGTVTDEAGKPVPEAFVVVHRRDMLFDFVTDYTGEDGKYRIHGLGNGEFLVHVDAAHRGLVRIRTPFELDGSVAETQRDFTLPLGVTISGKFVDEQGKEWRMARSHGYAAIPPDPDDSSGGTFSLSRFRNKFGPKDVDESASGSFSTGEGSYRNRQMFFPTSSTFLIQGMLPGKTQIAFAPKEEGQEVLEILYGGENIKESGIETKAGEQVKDVTIVIGKKRPGKAPEKASQRADLEGRRDPSNEGRQECHARRRDLDYASLCR